MKALYATAFLFLCWTSVFSQQKNLNAVRTSVIPKIDGITNDSCWNSAEVATDFIQRDLHPGLPSEQKTEIRILYDDNAIYVAANLYDTEPGKILKELSTRDNEANAELFGIFFDTYND